MFVLAWSLAVSVFIGSFSVCLGLNLNSGTRRDPLIAPYRYLDREQDGARVSVSVQNGNQKVHIVDAYGRHYNLYSKNNDTEQYITY